MSPVGSALEWGLPFTGALLAAVYAQKLAWSKPARTAHQAEQRAMVTQMTPLSYFGVRISHDRFVTSNATGRLLGPLDGAKARLEATTPVTKVKDRHGYAVIEFADGTEHRWPYWLRRQAEAQAQLARLETLIGAVPAGTFRRTKPAGRP